MRLSLLDNRRKVLLYLDENKTIPKYTVTWKNWDGSDLYVDTAAPEGGIPAYTGPTPSKPATQTVRYEFAGWEPTVVAVTGNTTYTAAFTEVPIMVQVQWLNYDSSVIKMEEVRAGTKPIYSGTNPTKPSTTQYRYNFIGWSPNPAVIYKDTVYTAQFQELPNTVTATFIKDSSDGGGTIKTITVNYGETPVFGSADPTSTKGVPPEITFEGWEPALGPITQNTTYTAVFKDNRPYTVQFLARVITEYTDIHEALTAANVTWLNWDGSLLELDRDIPIGTTPAYNGAIPVGPSDPAYIYTFAGWDKQIVPLTSFTTYTATFTKAIRTFKVTFVKDSADGGGTLKTINTVNYGDTPVYDGATPTTTKGTAEIFPFEGWEPELGPITADTVYTAKFCDLRPYTVKFLARDIKEYSDDHSSVIYTLPQATSFNGSSDYIDTGIKLMNIPSVYTIVYDAMDQSGTNFADMQAIFHCSHEVSPWPGITEQISSWSASDKGMYFSVNGTEYTGALNTSFTVNSTYIGRCKFVAVIDTINGTTKAWRSIDGTIYTNMVTLSPFVSITESLLIGANQDAQKNKGRYWKGILYDFKIYNRTFTDSEATAYLAEDHS